MIDTVVIRAPGVGGYGRHAAPPSAYGPTDVHRLLPAPPAGSGAAGWGDPGCAPVEAAAGPVRAEDAAATGAGSPDEAPARTTGFWARLRLLPGAA